MLGIELQRNATLTASRLEWTSSLARMLRVCVRTVPTDTKRSRAIVARSLPAMSPARISRSRSVEPGQSLVVFVRCGCGSSEGDEDGAHDVRCEPPPLAADRGNGGRELSSRNCLG